MSVGNAGGVGTTVAATGRLPFVVGIDRYLPPIFGKLHPRWKTPYVSILVQAGVSSIVLLLIQINETANSAYQILVDATTIIYFLSAAIYVRGGDQAVLSHGSGSTRERRADPRRKIRRLAGGFA